MIDKDNVTVGGFVITWIAGVFSAGKLYGIVSSDIKQTKKDLQEAKSEIVTIKREFITSDGDQRLMSFAAHDKIQATCQKRMDDRYVDVQRQLDQHDHKLDKILDAVQRGNNV